MPNSIKQSGEGVALQVTKSARIAGLVEEDSEGEWTRLADVRIYAFDALLLVVDQETVDVADIAELVASAVRDTDSIYRALDARIRVAGNGYMVSLPPASDAGFEIGHEAPVHPSEGVLIITDRSADRARLAEDLVTLRRAQLSDNQ